MTIYALSSGPGLSGIAVIRVSGSDTLITAMPDIPGPDESAYIVILL